MQTPQGHEIVNGQVVPVDWLAVIFNPSFPYRLLHMAIAAFLATAFFVGASAAWHLLRGRDTPGDPQDALDGDVDGADRRADAGAGRRCARPEHAEAPAGEDRRD